MSIRSAAAHLRAAFVIAFAIAATTNVTVASAQAARRDSTRTDSTRAQRLERVMISAVRGSGEAPISQKTLTSSDLQPRYFGQDVPLLLQSAAPSLTSYAETGNYWGYSYIRLRGIDQSRINLTLDGIPLNDPEDQVLYFADFPDLANSLRSVQVQRGVGTSSNGTAAYAGSINMETIPLAASPRSGNVVIERGSFGSRRVSGEFQSGLLPSRFAFYARASSLHTDGYRYQSGVDGKSVFVSAGYFGDRDILKFTATNGTMRDTMAYLAVPVTDLDTNRRINPLTPRERDGFGERLTSLSYTRLLTPTASVSITGYRIANSGDYDVQLDSLDQFNLNAAWGGATGDLSVRNGSFRFDLGGNASTYARHHFAFEHPDLTHPLYYNTGHKDEASGFAKAAYTAGAATLFGDLQVRHTKFRYTPDVHAGIGEQSIGWSFVNPKVGVTYAASSAIALYASYGSNSREPARSDMFAGFDNLDTSNVAFVGDLHRVRPETVHDLEVGLIHQGAAFDLQANVYSMNFRNEIAPIGQLSYIGTPLRQNVGASYRRGIEADATYRGIRRLQLSANATASTNRIKSYTDATGDTPVTYHDVQPLLTPRFTSFQRAGFATTRHTWVAFEGHYTSRSFLQNTSDPRFVLPATYTLDASASWHTGPYELVVRGNNLTDSKKYGSGYASGDVAYYYVLPPRNLFVEVRLGF